MERPPNGHDPDDEGGEAEGQEDTAAQADLIGRGDVEEFKRLFDTHYESLHRYALRYLRSAEEANDAVHDVFLQMWRHRERIGLGRDLRSYLYTTTRNHALDRLKRRKVEDSFLQRPEPALAHGRADVEIELESRELAATIQRASTVFRPGNARCSECDGSNT